MNNFKLSKKLKTLLWTSSVIVLNTAIASSLTSCSLFNKDVVDDIGGYDKQYGITQATYDKMENDFKEIYETDLETKHEQGDIDDEQHESSLSSFRSSLNSFHNTLNSKEYKTYSYTVKTNALRDFAKDNYGIRLARYTGVNLEDEIGQIKNSMIMNLSMMIDEYNVGAEKGKELINNASDAFEGYVNDAKEAYPNGDILSIIQYIQDKMVGCFDGICKEIDVIVTQKFLSDFLKNATIDVNQDVSEGKVESCCWNNLNYNKGQPIKEEDFNDIFDIKVKEFIPSLNSSLVSESTKIIPFRKDMITGYTLVPIVYDMVGDPFKNEYQIQIDYTLVNNRYANDTDVAKATVHSAIPLDQAIYENDDNDVYDMNVNDGERQPTSYELPITKDYERDQINKIYFNNEDFKFSWSKNEIYGYDDFWTKPNEEGKYNGKLDVFGLAASGMMINGILLSDILDKAGKISLSGGSISLSAKANTKGADTKQWKLIINNEEVDKNAIEWKLIPESGKTLPDFISIRDGIVSWTDKISGGPYKFYVLAIYEKTKIETSLITLTVSSSKQSENVKNFNHSIKDTLYDEKIIDQKLLDFVNNVDFYLDYTEHDYNTPVNVKKGEIQIDSLTIGYKNSKNTFKASSSINDLISNAINNESGLMERYSSNLWLSIKENYDNLVSSLDVKKLKDNLYDVRNTINSAKIKFSIMYALFSATTIVLCIIFCNLYGDPNKNSIDQKMDEWIKKMFAILPTIICIIICLIGIIASVSRTEVQIKKVEDKLDKLDPKKQSSYNIIKCINNDKKVFIQWSRWIRQNRVQ